ncbi:RagB/SusD family nutrient uptake outer membrane protein [Hymenobacter sp. BT186]|uniref:RagB/SusD family nutrient uptake outer membrane protein n=1 Tax=Hymenobacter telluris TaxID=2816474 RepID=A0A939EYZ1_9BACT|nr:RagB/SusD family nutrient uptake outer membrane protein [Hymenobacter telluris]MBO0359167.1 RagB/SusD family nutrient uptake outer membrane protein [Hymenobacter telluris]MBW3375193.1 RagB/SusD family nutrient uptake outer membrane protein [Hymenobacter norwichensis]
MKRIVLATLGTALFLSVSSCQKDILEEEPQSVLTPSFLKTQQGVEAGTTGVYSGLRQIYGNDAAFFTTEAGTDQWTTGISASSGLSDYNNNDLTPVNDGSHSFIWTVCYTQINNANGVLQFGPEAQGIAPARLEQLIAQVKLLRAQYYFVLVQDFGDVPLMLSFVDAPTKTIVRAPLADVYTQIIKDLTESLAVIADRPAQPGRVTRATALHLLSKVYLTRATSSAKQANDYTLAAQYAKELIDNQTRYGLGLEADPATVFAEGNENGKEVIFNAQFSSDATFNRIDGFTFGGENIAGFQFRSRYDLLPNMARDINNGRPFARHVPTYYLENSYILRDAAGNALESEGTLRTTDTRYNKWFTTVYRVNSPGANSGSTRAVAGDTAVWYPGRQLSAQKLAQIAARQPIGYRVIQPNQYTTEFFPTLNKFDSRNRTSVNGFSTRPNIIYRLAETYLVAAEANFYLGNLTQARDYINVVRRRAAAAGRTTQMEITTSQVTLDFILDERMRELCGEFTRWYDLKRTGQLLTRIRNTNITPAVRNQGGGVYGSNAAVNIRDFHVLRPIPQTEIDRTSGLITQNPGY